VHKKWRNIFTDKFGEIRAKILRTPKNLPAPIPVLFDAFASGPVQLHRLILFSFFSVPHNLRKAKATFETKQQTKIFF